ncbi:MAG: YggT family protein [Miltoncostaeaceae bacterium]
MDEVRDYLVVLITVFLLVIFGRILLSFVPRPPVAGWMRAVYNFFFQSTEWYLGFFRRFIPPLGMFDLSPILGIIVLFVLQGVLSSL